MLQAAPVHQAHQAQSLSHRAPIRHAVLQHHLAEGNDNFPLRGEFHCIGKKIDNHLTDAQLIRLCKVLHSDCSPPAYFLPASSIPIIPFIGVRTHATYEKGRLFWSGFFLYPTGYIILLKSFQSYYQSFQFY